MRIAILTYLYNEMISYVYELFPNLNKLNYLDQKKSLIIISEFGLRVGKVLWKSKKFQ